MPNYKLYYFNVRARAEVSRFMFALAGVDYEDCRFEFSDWPEHKPKAPFGQAPFLEVDGKFICQSHAIERYLARQFGFAGKTAWDEACVDMIIECMEDYLKLGIEVRKETDEDKKKEKLKKVADEQAPNFLSKLDKICKDNGHRGHFVGNEITVADLIFYQMVHQVSTFVGQDIPGSWDKYPNVKAVYDGVENHPKIKAWMEKRPVTSV